jgi:PST family polysaccharide transporter
MPKEHHSRKSYQGILKSAAVLGSARVMTLVIGLGRIKILAVIIGPVGVGLIGTFDVLIMMAIYVFGLGVQASGVRQVAVARSEGDPDRTALTIATLRRLSWVLGLVGALVIGALAWVISRITFKDSDHGIDILTLAPAIFLTSIYGGLISIVQGCQRIDALARITVLSAVGQAIAVVIFVYLFGERGIAVSFVASSVFSLFICRWIARDIIHPKINTNWRRSVQESGTFIKLGLGLTNALLLSTLVTYVTRTLIARNLGLEEVGIYLCAYSLSGKFIGFLLDAMQTDFYPRLSAASKDHGDLNQLVNHQTEIVLLMAMPGLLVTLAFAPWLVRLFYSGAFSGATILLRWFILGCLVRVIYAPIAFVQLAKGRSLLYFLSEAFINISALAATFILLKTYGLTGAAASYLVGNIFQTVVLLAIAFRLTGFKWSAHAVRLLLLFIPLSCLCVAASYYLSELQSTLLSGTAAILTSYFCLHQLSLRLGPEHRLSRVAGMLPFFRESSPLPMD